MSRGIDLRYVVVPDEEIVEPIHMTAGPRQMLCGATGGIGVGPWDESRVTCPDCKRARGISLMPRASSYRNRWGLPRTPAGVLRTIYEQRIRNAWANRCWRCVVRPFHG